MMRERHKMGQTGVALFSAYYPSHGGGMELATAELVRALIAADMQVEWVSLADGEPASQAGEHRTPVPGTDVIYDLSGVPLPLPMPWAILAVWRAVRRTQVTIVVEANFVLSILGFIAAKLSSRPTVLVQHVGRPSTVSRLAGAIMRLGEKLAVRPMVRGADAMVYVSPVVANYFDGEREPDSFLIIGHGVDMSIFRPSAGSGELVLDKERLGIGGRCKVACFVGRLTESKGISVVAEMARLRPDWTFAIAGSGPVDPADWNLPNVVVLGQLDREEVARLYRVSDVAVLPSQSESYSLVVREALASDSQILCADQILDTDGGLAPYIVTETVDLSDVSATAARFADALGRLAGTRKNDGRNYIAARCSWTAAGASYVQVVKDLMRAAQGRQS